MKRKYLPRGFKNVGFEKYGGQFIGLIFNTLIMFYADSQVFGKFALISVFLSFANMLSEGGFTIGLIKASDKEFHDIKIIINLIQLLFSATCIVWLVYFSEFALERNLLILLAISILSSGPLSILNAYYSRLENWKVLSYMGFLAQFVSVLIGLIFILNKDYLAALISRLAMRNILLTIFLFRRDVFVYENYITPSKSLKSLKSIFKFTLPIYFSGFLNNYYEYLTNEYIGGISLSTLGLYNRGKQICDFSVRTTTIIFEKILFIKTKGFDNLNSFINIWKYPLIIIILIWSIAFLLNASFSEKILNSFLPQWEGLASIILIILIVNLFQVFTFMITSYNYSNGKSRSIFFLNVIKVLCLFLSIKNNWDWGIVLISVSILEAISILILTVYNEYINNNHLV